MISFIVTVVLIGVLLWAVTTYIPMDANIKKFLVIAVVICLVLWFLAVIGLLPMSLNAPMPRIN